MTTLETSYDAYFGILSSIKAEERLLLRPPSLIWDHPQEERVEEDEQLYEEMSKSPKHLDVPTKPQPEEEDSIGPT
ncbi:hypothetical protein VNO77_02312 [Canavalia gladiata]|uniref:Uncharacterized protein n=1 Tax=Canavalia gladiata TaxID=3824 RepID=A0AAN9MTE9_CANGL